LQLSNKLIVTISSLLLIGCSNIYKQSEEYASLLNNMIDVENAFSEVDSDEIYDFLETTETTN
jgi:hypothetical protein